MWTPDTSWISSARISIFYRGYRSDHRKKELPVIKFEEMQLLQVMQNLVSNALKYRRETPASLSVCAAKGLLDLFGERQRHRIREPKRREIFMPFKRLQKGTMAGAG